MPYGSIRERPDGILEFRVGKIDKIKQFLELVGPFIVLKQPQVQLLQKIIEQKQKIKSERDFNKLLQMIDGFAELNYSKKRIRRGSP